MDAANWDAVLALLAVKSVFSKEELETKYGVTYILPIATLILIDSYET